jgi:hypothetical protein
MWICTYAPPYALIMWCLTNHMDKLFCSRCEFGTSAVSYRAVQYLWRLLAGFPRQRSVVEPGSSHVGSVVDRAALGQVSSKYLSFTCHSFIPLIARQSSASIIKGWYSSPMNCHSKRGVGSSPAPGIKINKNYIGHGPLREVYLTYRSWHHCCLHIMGREVDHSPEASAEIRKMWIYISTPPYVLRA